MNEPKLFSATVGGERNVPLWKVEDVNSDDWHRNCYVRFGEREHHFNKNLTDLQPLLTHTANDVVIKLTDDMKYWVGDFTANPKGSYVISYDSIIGRALLDFAKQIRTQVPDLRPSQLSQEVGEERRIPNYGEIIKCYSCGVEYPNKLSGHSCEGKSTTNPSPAPSESAKVEMGLTEEQRKDLLTYLKMAKAQCEEKEFGLIHEERIDSLATFLISISPMPEPTEPPYRSVVITPQGMDIPDLNHQSVPWAYQRTIDGEDGDLSWQMIATSDEWYTWKQICKGATVVFNPKRVGE